MALKAVGFQPVAVRLAEDLVLFGCLERAIQAEQAAGSRDQDAAFPHSLPPSLMKTQDLF